MRVVSIIFKHDSLTTSWSSRANEFGNELFNYVISLSDKWKHTKDKAQTAGEVDACINALETVRYS